MSTFDDILPLVRLYRNTTDTRRSADLKARIDSALRTQNGTVASADPDFYKLKLRQLSDAEAPWEYMESLCWRLCNLEDSPETAAYVLKLAFLHGSPEHIRAAIVKLQDVDASFYGLLHAKIRMRLLQTLWRTDVQSTLFHILQQNRTAPWLAPEEKLGVFFALNSSNECAASYTYFRKHEAELLKAVATAYEFTGVTPSRIYYTMAQNCVQISHFKEALEFVQRVSPEEKEYESALQLIIFSQRKEDLVRKSDFGHLLSSEKNPYRKVAIFENFLRSIRLHQGDIGINHVVLNLLLDEPLKWFPAKAEIWEDLSKALLQYRDLLSVLPNLLKVFASNVLRFHDPLLDVALWRPWLEFSHEDAFAPWIGIASLHLYLGSAGKDEKALWRAKRLLSSGGWEIPGNVEPLSWLRLITWARSEIAKTIYFLEMRKQEISVKLILATSPEDLTIEDIREYVRLVGYPPLYTADDLLSFVQHRGHEALEFELITAFARQGHLRNKDIKRIFSLAAQTSKHDLAWRACTVLKGRTALPARVEPVWNICGENRSLAVFTVPTHKGLRACLSDLPEDAVRLVSSLFYVGSALVELLPPSNPDLFLYKVEKPATGSCEARLQAFWDELPWKRVAGKKTWVNRHAAYAFHAELPPFVQFVPENEWSIAYVKLSFWMGMHAWKWKASLLRDALAKMRDQGKGTGLLKRTSPLYRWLRDLNAHERAAFTQLTQVLPKMSDEDVAAHLATFTFRLATLMVPHHLQSLQSLQAMRVPTHLIWGHEQWILGEPYSQARESVKLQSKVPVPKAMVIE